MNGNAKTASNAENRLIVARATAAGPGAVAIVRLDGEGVRTAVDKMFHSAAGQSPLGQPRRLVFGRWRDAATGETLDEGLAVFFPAPHSYTGNDLAEFHCHGGTSPARRLIEAAAKLGARPAEPGEFTRRAYLNGRMDLAQAEAVADLINAQTDAAARAAQGQLSGGLSAKIRAVREPLLDLAAEIEARIDFPDEELGEADRARLGKMFADAAEQIAALLATRRRGQLLREGARVALAGRPNAGKSSLLNALARRERAIVTPHPGTTRDTVECTVELAGIPVTLIDTAGLRESSDPIEKLGIDRTREEIERADLVIEVIDLSEFKNGGESAKIERDPALESRKPDLVVWNKCDLIEHSSAKPSTSHPSPRPVLVSAVRGDGLAELESALLAGLSGDANASSGANSGVADAFAVGLRHAELLDQAANSLSAAKQSFDNGVSGEFTMVDLKESLDALSRILGTEIGDAVLDRIFNRFCIGK